MFSFADFAAFFHPEVGDRLEVLLEDLLLFFLEDLAEGPRALVTPALFSSISSSSSRGDGMRLNRILGKGLTSILRGSGSSPSPFNSSNSSFFNSCLRAR